MVGAARTFSCEIAHPSCCTRELGPIELSEPLYTESGLKSPSGISHDMHAEGVESA
jgi:hypothetical protein